MKTADIWRPHHWFPREMTSDKRERSSILMTTTSNWVLTPHQYGISALLPRVLFCLKTNGRAAKYRLFPQANFLWSLSWFITIFAIMKIFRDNFILILGYLMKWSIIFYGTVSNPLEKNLHVPIQFSNRTSLSKYLVQLFFSLLSPDYLLYYF